ncbi:MMS19 nucleotide excision repair protein homolog isoform X2 [Cynara cardunculus var. scolymus]|uniref:MMS19 nucleotide excision repair protein homolog isoform X2 n=1 Tax=Cynara cardunculus var. scolymus TaxID=59895 RepID=UPI000D62A7D9|nr:MMS19 nucleotide excision repair protein homolog isoform X2 [Cynara cardunculus var. scolymus]
MADSTTTNCVKHIETYVDSSSSKSPAQQDASLDAIAKLLLNDIITLESLVREMEMYLTTTDNIIRARGILLLAELLTRISSKPLDNTTIHSLIGFFAEKLSDWRALRGALVGCLALMRRKGDTGAISSGDANGVAQSFMQNLQVQSLGQHDRKLCFEILECLIDCYPDTVMTMEDDFVYVICEAIDGEKDPQCLLLTFHLVEMLAQLYPDSSSSLASYAEDLFNILGSYFPIHFTHPKGEDDVKREELSRALMLAFGSTALFEPFAVPLLLEKLSSSLPSAKVESLKYLSYCTVKYGAHRMLEHLEALWSSLKDAVFTSGPSMLTVGSYLESYVGYQDNKIVAEALILLQKLIQQDNGVFLDLVLKDMDINMMLTSLLDNKNYDDITVPDKQRLNAVGRILYVSAAASIASCNAIFQSFFSSLVNGLGSTMQNPLGQEKDYVSEKPKFGYLYICVELLAACRTLVVGYDEPTSITYLANETWCSILHSFCSSLTSSLIKSLKEINQDDFNHTGVRGLQILASFPGSFLPVSKSTFENILVEFMSIIVLNFNNTSLWRYVLKALVEIGSFIEKSHDSEKMPSFDVIVVERMVVLLSYDDSTMPLSLKVEAVSEIGRTSLKYMLKIVQELNKAISTSLHGSWLDGNSKPAEHAMLLLECYADKVLPWFQNVRDSDDVPMHFALKIWDEIEDSTRFVEGVKEKELLETTMNAMKHAVASCSEDSQSILLDKAFSILSSSTTFRVEEGLQLAEFSCRDKWIISLFDSVIIALHPKTHLKNTEGILQILMRSLPNGHVPSAHALGSLFNKMPLKENRFADMQYCSLEEAMDIIFNSYIWKSCDTSHPIRFVDDDDDGNEIGVKDVIKFLLNCLVSNGHLPTSNGDSPEDCKDQETTHLMRAAADSFSIIMSDSEACLNKRLHATIRPLYKQRLFNMVMPILLSSVVKSDSPITRSMLHRALAHVISNSPLSAILGEANKLIPLLLDGLTILSEDVQNRDIVYNLLLVLSGILTAKNGREAIMENTHIIIRCLNKLVFYPHMMLVRETAIQCLTAMSELPHPRVYPFRLEVLQALTKALDDPKRSVRQEAVKCRQAWASSSSRSLHI